MKLATTIHRLSWHCR